MDNKKESFLAHLKTHLVEIDEANRGNPYAAKSLLSKCANLLRTGQPIPAELNEWLANRLDAVARGKTRADYEKGLQLNNRKAREFGAAREREELIARSIMESKLGRHKGYTSTDKGPVPTGAYSEAAEQFHISPSTAESYYLKHADGLREMDKIDAELRRENEE